MITHDPRWSLPRGNTLVPSRWQATRTGCGPAWEQLRRGLRSRERSILSVVAARVGNKQPGSNRLMD